MPMRPAFVPKQLTLALVSSLPQLWLSLNRTPQQCRSRIHEGSENKILTFLLAMQIGTCIVEDGQLLQRVRAGFFCHVSLTLGPAQRSGVPQHPQYLSSACHAHGHTFARNVHLATVFLSRFEGFKSLCRTMPLVCLCSS